MGKIKNCPCCNHHDMYEITQVDDMGTEIPALFCNACKMIFTVENDSPYMSDEKTFEYLKEKLHEKFNTRNSVERINKFLDQHVNIESELAKSDVEGKVISHQYAANCMKMIRDHVNEGDIMK